MYPLQATTRLVLLTLLAAGAVACTDQRAHGPRSVTVTGQGEASGRPDQAQVNAGVMTFADTVVKASQENQAVIERIMAALEEQGIAEEKIRTSNYSISAEQHYQGPRQNQIAGYRVSNIVNIEIDELQKVGEVLAAVTNAGANSIHGVRFGVRDTAALEESAREGAMADARARAEALARLAGVKLGDILTISTSTNGGPPQPLMMSRSFEMADTAPAPGISPGQQSLSVYVQATFAIR